VIEPEPRCVADIEGPWIEPDLDSGLIQRLRANWSVPVDRLDNHVLATFLRQRRGLAVVVQEAELRLLAGYRDESEMFDEELEEALHFSWTPR